MLRVVTFLIGCAAIAAGAGLALGLWATLVLGGAALCVVALAAERAAAARAARTVGR